MHKDRVDFTKNINCNVSLEDIVKGYFDEVMALYDLIATYDNFKIEGTVENANIYFNLKFKNKSEAEKMFSIINNIRISKYNRNFICIVQHNDNTLCVTLRGL